MGAPMRSFHQHQHHHWENSTYFFPLLLIIHLHFQGASTDFCLWVESHPPLKFAGRSDWRSGPKRLQLGSRPETLYDMTTLSWRLDS